LDLEVPGQAGASRASLTRFEPPGFLALPGIRVRQRAELGDGFGPAALLAGGLSLGHQEFAQVVSLVPALVRPPDIGAPALEHVLASGVVCGVRVAEEIARFPAAETLEVPAQDLAGQLAVCGEFPALMIGDSKTCKQSSAGNVAAID
jgi:hypothetical protein